ncbi:putative metalloprotease CJM1_0395 family protein [Marinimicrobium sp. ABcell2]|uniref:putative metalloprotease CJM1_0395 family protein n=1 Tax=Marinimicrobium sp. ABcell2 TaxID=3069751 RepID=UPI0027B55A9B|nr:putative metalloprotease CJM1_0395 family protein [Marinimicrobium sp. ABcell2]MDQ2076320.1 putative metalloprotease CJM1_0395 family protein [Marinimicrobium sp. ABcell2]
MMPTIPPNHANAIAPFSPLGRQAVSEENTDLKARASTLKALEAAAETARSENRRSPDERAGEAGEQVRLSHGRNQNTDEQEVSAIERRSAEQGQQEEARQVRELAVQDRKVRLQEQVYAAMAGRHAGAPRYQYVRGPDGSHYAVSGEVPVDLREVPGDPRATLEKARQLLRAAYAPLEPSEVYRRVAAQAGQLKAEARAELLREQAQKLMKSLQVLRGIQDDTADQGDSMRVNQDQSVQVSRGQRELAQRPSDLSRRLIDMGVDDDPTPLGHRLDHNI